jgi:putative endonuclease
VAAAGARQARELGRRAEIAAADFLFARGFAVLGRNVRVGPLEIDVVARQGPLVALVEVRTRRPGALVGPFESVGRAKQARLLRAARRLWERDLARLAGVDRVRIDVAAVTFEDGRTRVEHAEGVVSA